MPSASHPRLSFVLAQVRIKTRSGGQANIGRDHIDQGRMLQDVVLLPLKCLPLRVAKFDVPVNERTLYAVLAVPRDVSPGLLRKAYRRLALRLLGHRW